MNPQASDIVGDRWVWRELEGGERTEWVLTTDQLADAIPRELLDRWETPQEEREYRVSGARWPVCAEEKQTPAGMLSRPGFWCWCPARSYGAEPLTRVKCRY